MKKQNFNNNQKLILVAIIASIMMFLIYHLTLSPYAQCVDGYKKRYGSTETEIARAKIYCGRQSG